MQRSIYVALCVLAFLNSSVAVQAAVIDDFSFPGGVVLNGNFVGFPFAPGTLGPHVDGSIVGSRTITTAGVFTLGDGVGVGPAFGPNPPAGDGVLSIAVGPMGTFATTLDYAFGPSINLSGDTGLQFDFLKVDPEFNATSVAIEVEIYTDSGTLTFAGLVPGSNAASQFIAQFSAFTGTGNLGSVSGISVFFNVDNDSAEDILLTTLSTVPMPEPSTLLAWGLVIGAGTLVRRRFGNTARGC